MNDDVDLLEIAQKAGCTELQIHTLKALAAGMSIRGIAGSRGVTRRGVQATRDAAFHKIRQHLGNPEQLTTSSITNRQAHAAQLREAGHSWRYIAESLNISRDSARRLYERAQTNTPRQP